MDSEPSNGAPVTRADELLELGDALCELDSEWRVVRVNRAQEKLFRRPRTETLGRNFWELWPDTEAAEMLYRQDCSKCMEQRIAVEFDAFYWPFDLWTAVSAHPVSDGGMALFFRDVGDAKRAQKALSRTGAELEAERSRLQTIIDTIPTGLIMLNDRGAMVLENAEWKRTWAGNALLDSIVDYDSYKGFRPDTGERIGAMEWPCAVSLKQGIQTRDVILDIERFNGTRGTIVVSSSPLRDEQGNVIGAVTANMDISELRAAQKRAEEADKRKDEFLVMLSHELRNPLAPIRTSLYVLDHVGSTSPEARRARDVINRQVTHLTGLVDDLLDVTRIARGKIEVRRARLDFAALAERTAEDYSALLAANGIALAIEAPGPIHVDGDEIRLVQMLGNLLSNAAKFTQSGGRIAVEVRADGGHALATVRDDGIGISPDLLPSIFEPFTQASQESARTQGGLGLGLALVKGVAELHGGSVAVVSAPGAGSTFTVRLPLLGGEPQAPCVVDLLAAKAGTRRYKVLVVDDNADAADSLAELVRMFGHEANVAYDGRGAIASVESDRPDLVLCDIGLPGMNGYELARALRPKLSTATRMIAVSGYAQPDDVKKSAEAGFDGHVAKPPDPRFIERLLASE